MSSAEPDVSEHEKAALFKNQRPTSAEALSNLVQSPTWYCAPHAEPSVRRGEIPTAPNRFRYHPLSRSTFDE